MNTPHLSALLSSVCLSAAVLSTADLQADSTVFYVSPHGNDAWKGTLSAPAKDGANGPFRTIARAQEALRSHPQRAIQPLTVKLRGGTYELPETLLFTPEDSGAPEAPVTWEGFANENVVISGARSISGWTVQPDGTWTTVIPDAKNGNRPDGKWNINQLFINGTRRQRARLPKYPNYFRMNGRPTAWNSVDEAKKDQRSYDTLVFHDEDILPLFKQADGSLSDAAISNGQMIVYHSWTASVHHIKSVDFQNHRFTLTRGTGYPMGRWDANGRYHLENLPVCMTDPGEWYMDFTTGTLHYRPLPGETPDNVKACAPILSVIMFLKGDSQAGLLVQDINFRNLKFHYNTFDLNTDQSHDGQAASALRGAVRLEAALNCNFDSVEIAHTGTYGLDIGRGSRHNTIRHSEITDLGGGGVRIGETASEPVPENACGHNLVENCFIHDGGLVAMAAVGAIIFRTSYNTLRHNEICDFFYSAVSIGWSWGYAPSSANHNIVEYCHLHHLGYGVLSDMGAVYTLGISPGTVVRGNHIHDVFSHDYGGWGLYTDEGSSGVIMEDNVVYNTKSGGFHQHYGKENIIRGNLLAFAQEGQVIRSRQEAHRSFTFENNVVIFNNGRPYGGNWGNGNYLMQNNLYWDTTGLPFGFSGFPVKEWLEEEKQEQGTVLVDPKFRDAEHFDFTPLPGSPALPLVGKALELCKTAGLTGDEAWKQRARAISYKLLNPNRNQPNSSRPQVYPSNELVLDFQDCKPGDKSPRGSTIGENPGLKTSIRVTDEIQAPGNHKALKFIDAAGQKVIWTPFLSYSMSWQKCLLNGEYDVYINHPDAVFWHEWRDSSAPYKVGPCLRFLGNGSVLHGNLPLTTVPTKRWIHVRITCSVTPDAPKTFTVELTPEGEQPKRFDNLAFGNNDWNALTWIGFVSESDKASDFYIANLNFTRKK